MKRFFKVCIIFLLLFNVSGCKQNEKPDDLDDNKPQTEIEDTSIREKIDNFLKKNKYEEAIKLCAIEEKNTIILKWLEYLLQNAKTISQDDVNKFLSYNIDSTIASDYEKTIIKVFEESHYLNENALEIYFQIYDREGIKKDNSDDFFDLFIIQTEISRILGIIPSNYDNECYADKYLSSNKYCDLFIREIENTVPDKFSSLKTIYQVLDRFFKNKMSFSVTQVQRLLKAFENKGNVPVTNQINYLVLNSYFSGLIDKGFLLAYLQTDDIEESSLYSDVIYILSNNPSIDVLKKYIELVQDENGKLDDTLLNNTIKKQIEDNNPINYDEIYSNLIYTDWTNKKIQDKDEHGTGYGFEIVIYNNYVISITSEPVIGYIRYVNADLKNIIGYEAGKYYFIANDIVYSIDINNYEVKEQFTQKDIIMLEVVNDNIICLLSDNSIVSYNINTQETNTSQFTNWEDITNRAINSK